MAVILKDSKNYIKVDLDSSYFKSDGVFVASFIYSDKDMRDKEKERLPKIQDFLEIFNLSIIDKQDEFQEYAKNKDIESSKTEQEALEKLGEEGRALLATLENMRADYEYINEHTYIGSSDDKGFLNRIKNIEYARKLGFKDEWITDPLYYPVQTIKRTGAYIRQQFTYTDMYKELKKVYKNEQIEDI